jgi:serine/threonine protein kinase
MTRGTHPTVEQTPGIGDAIGRYRIIGVLGDGSLGNLYVAEQHGIRGISKTVALRCIRPELARNPQFRARFSEAASLAARCEHPNVVTVFEMGSADGHHFISMEYLPGENVGAIVSECLFNQCNSRDHLTPDIAAYVVKQAAAALQYLHDLREPAPQRVTRQHDEIDGSNVFVSYHGTVKWLGVGLRSLARTLETISADRASSPMDAAPASATTEADADRHTDVFGLGVLLWTCLVGREPARVPGSHSVDTAALAIDAAALNAAALNAAMSSRATPTQPLAPSGPRTDVPGALAAIVRQALSADPRERFASPRAMSDALDRYLLRSDSRPTPKHLRRWMERVFGAERASLQMQIARGRDVEAALARLGAPQPPGSTSRGSMAFSSPRPRPLWSTSHSVFAQLSRASITPRSFERVTGSTLDESSRITSIPTRHMPSNFMSVPSSLASAELPPLQPPQDPGAPASRMWLASTVLAACAVLAVGVLLIFAASSESALPGAAGGSTSADRSGRVDVRSTPEGAAVFVDGEPTGLRTPVVLKGLVPGRTIRLRVDKSGFASQERQIEIAPGGAAETRSFELLASGGLVLFAGVPADASIYVDDALVTVEPGAPLNLPVGAHAVRVETPSGLLFSDQVDIVPGEQTIHVAGGPTTP